MLVTILILFFILLLTYQTYNHFFHKTWIEGLDNPDPNTESDQAIQYKPYDPNNPIILAQQNAGNIEYLKQKIAGLENMQKEINDMSLNLITVNDQIHGLIQQQQQAATQLVGTTPINITGTSSA